ncbi:putative FMN-binding regulatory protein PaiB [Bradyrhizobium elkanii]
MYTPPPFRPDRAASLAFAEARGFGIACAWDGGKPIASALPFYLTYAADGTPRALFHVARHNPLIKLAGATSWLLAVNGARRLCFAGLVRVTRSGADLALSGGASDRAGAEVVG